jgi:hypothetical protein
VARTTCPSCDAPAPARARACARCGYRFFEDGGPARHLPRLDRAALTVGGGVAAFLALIVAIFVLVGGGSGGDQTASATPREHLTILAQHPLSRRPLERLLEERYLPIPDDDEADVTCSGRIPKPAHSVRRCRVHYPGGAERSIAVLTNARGAELLSSP